MTPKRWQQIKALFDAAVELDEKKRAAFLGNACAGDADLRLEVEKMLGAFDAEESFLESPAAESVASVILDANAKLSPGQMIGHYEIVSQIGVGGMGEVFLAKDKKLERRVAIKVLNARFSSHKANLERFTREAKAASALNHPNILVIHEIGESEKTNYIVSEYVVGKTLRELRLPMNTSEILDVAIQIAGALAAAHGERIVHRDIKPENIMRRPDGYVKVLDFGLAKLIEGDPAPFGLEDETKKQNHTARGTIMGTVNYMSPEQAKGEKVDERTDIFSLGVLVYEMIAGRTPFEGDSVSETFANLIKIEPQPLSRFATNVQDELQRIVSKTLRKKREERYQTALDLLTDLKDLRENLAFDEKLERSRSSGEERITVDLQSTTAEVKNTDQITGLLPQLIRNRLAAIVAVFILLCGSIGGYFAVSAWRGMAPSKSRKTLAVLPLINSSHDPNAEYLADGITESVINNLSQLAGLKVMSRNSAFRFKDDQTDTMGIAAKLGVETLVTGDIRQIGDKLVINVRLINASDDSQIWGNQYVKNSTDVIVAQSEIARAIAQNLSLKLSSSDQQQLSRSYTTNPEAYQFYLQGRYHYFKLTLVAIREAIANYQKAIDLDPTYALAYAGIADAYRTIPIASWGIPSKEAFPQSKAAAKKALELDPNLAEAHTTLGWVGFFFDWDWAGAERDLKKGIELAPNSSDAHRAYGQFLSIVGRHEEALAEIKQAREQDPMTLITNALEGQFLFYAGREDEALDRLQKTISIEPNFWIAHNSLGRLYIQQGRFAEAITELSKAKELTNGGSTEPLWQLGYAYAKSGEREKALAAIQELRSLPATIYVPDYCYAMIYNGLGETDQSFKYLDRSLEQRDAQLAFAKIDKRWDNLRPDPRFAAILRGMNVE